MIHQTDICIIGSGPGGAAAALQLDKLGIPCMLVDKAVFPRDKICGDGISSKSVTLLDRLCPGMIDSMQTSPQSLGCWGVKFVAPNQKVLDVPFYPKGQEPEGHAPGFVCKRLDFDNYLVEEVRLKESIQFLEGVRLDQIEKRESGFLLSGNDGRIQIESKLVIAADGAHSTFARKYAGMEMEPAHFAGGVRAYYRNVSGIEKGNFIELHFVKSFLPGYFWIFPLGNGEANVGAGMASSKIRKKNINLKKSLLEIIENHPAISKRFENAEMIGKIQGFGLPLGSKKRKISGDNFMLVGDAGYLIDPMTGEGIANAIYSGVIAADQAQKCLSENNFSADFLKAYDKRVYRVMGQELRLSTQLQKTLKYPFIFNSIASLTTRNKRLSELVSCMFTDFDLAKQLRSPLFWAKLILNR